MSANTEVNGIKSFIAVNAQITIDATKMNLFVFAVLIPTAGIHKRKDEIALETTHTKYFSGRKASVKLQKYLNDSLLVYT